MARQSSLLNSIKGKIWLATSVLAFFICTFGLISYLIVSFLVNDPFYAVFIPFLFLAFTVMVFGWWLMNEVVAPIEKVTLLAKSMERSVSNTLPKTLGSVEADELLQTLHRNNQQIHTLVNLMDEVTRGNTDVALTPLQNSDRLINSFQQLLARITESVNAKRDLEKLQAALNQITKDIASVRSGNLNVEIKADFAQTKEISETFKYLIHHLNELITQIKTETLYTQQSAGDIKKTIAAVIQQNETRVQEMNQAALTLKQMPISVQKISDDLSGSALSANQSIEKTRNGARSAQENLNAASQLRKQIQAAFKQIQKLNERAEEIGKVAKTVEDLAHRTNMIALNASLASSENASATNVIAEEVERLAVRATNMNRQISSLNKSILAEISQAENALQSTVGEAANLSKYAIETGNALSELERYFGQFINLQNKLVSYSREQFAETESAFQVFVESITVVEEVNQKLKESDSNIAVFSKFAENLQLSVVDFKLRESFGNTEMKVDLGDFAEPNHSGQQGENLTDA